MKSLFVFAILLLTFHNSYYANKSNKIVNLDGNTYLIDNKYEKNLFSTKLGEKFSKFLINLDAKKLIHMISLIQLDYSLMMKRL